MCYTQYMKSFGGMVTGAALVGYMLLAVFGLVVMSSMEHHSMSGMNHCPFMIGEQALCTMSVVDHVSAWQSLVSVTLAVSVVVLLPYFFVFFILNLRPPNTARARTHIRPLHENLFTRLFSSGILNPKVF